MPDSTLPDLPLASGLTGTEHVYCVQDGADKRTNPAQVATYVASRFVFEEEPTDNEDGTFTLAHTPVAGSVVLHLNGIRIRPGAGNDYQIAGAVVTVAAYPLPGAGYLVADYQY